MGVFCIYHKGCVDGLMSAAIVQRAYPNAQFWPGTYGEQPPLDRLQKEQVIIVDFSYPADELAQIAEEAASVLVLDHHKSAQAALQGFKQARCEIIFDMSRSGAGMTWDRFFGRAQARPWLVDAVEDRDLWKFALPDTKEIHYAIGLVPLTVNHYVDLLEQSIKYAPLRDQMVRQGVAIRDFYRQQLDQLKEKRFRAIIAGHKVPVVNAPYFFSSELAGELATNAPFGVTYYFDGKRFNFSLRSRGAEGADVSEIATGFGGGGHRNAAGFSIETADFPFNIIME